jgi:hypothetical protein
MGNYTNAACKSLRASGLDAQSTYPLLDLIEKWVKSSGPEWTVSRLKSMKQSFIHQLAGQPHLAKNDLSWIKHGMKGPKGPFKRIFAMTKKPHKAISALMVYSSFLAPYPTKKQLEKFYSAAETNEVHVSHVPVRFSKRMSSYQDRWTDLNTFLEKGTRVPVYHEAKRSKWPFETTSPAFNLRNLLHGSDREEYLRSGEMSYDNVSDSAFTPLIEKWFNSQHETLPEDYYKIISRGAFSPSSDEYDYVGLISHIQEPGYKLRVVANPLPVYQLALSRLGNRLYDWLRDCESDCTFNQDKGITDIQIKMKEGLRLMSIDLSNATDSFPLEYTLRALRAQKCFIEEDLELFEKVSRGKFFDPMNGKGYTRWTKGQPLGLFPSFAAFAFSHHCIVSLTEPKFYRILGDDIVIDRDAGLRLLEIYKNLGVSTSPSKSLDSPILNEFGGRLISREMIIAQPKWRELSDNSFLDVVRNLGPTSVGLLRPRQRRVVKLLSEVPKGLHPYALGWNPKGKPYNQRVQESQWLLDTIKPTTHNFSSKTARSLGDLKTQIRYHQKGEFHIDSEPSKGHSQFESVESRILHLAGVTRVDAMEEKFLDWTLRSSLSSDPRGMSTLERIERVCTSAPDLSL